MNTPGTTAKLFAGLAEWYGLKGTRHKIELRFLSMSEHEVSKPYHRRFTYRFVDAAGHRFEWHTDTVNEDLQAGGEYMAVFTIKAHLKDVSKTTRIQRCAFRRLE